MEAIYPQKQRKLMIASPSLKTDWQGLNPLGRNAANAANAETCQLACVVIGQLAKHRDIVYGIITARSGNPCFWIGDRIPQII